MFRSLPQGQRVLGEALERIYDAALRPEGWSDVLAYLAQQVGSGVTVLSMHDVLENRTIFNARTSEFSEAVRDYEAYFHRLNPWFQAGPPPPGEVLPGEAVISLKDVKRTEFYNDFGKRYGVVHSAAAILQRDRTRVTYLSLNRGEDRKRFRRRELGLVRELYPHLNRALTVSQQLEFRHQWLEGWEACAQAMVMLKEGRVVEANPMALQIFEQKNGLCRVGERLEVAAPFQQRFARLLEAGRMRPSGPLQVPRAGGRAPLALWCAPWRTPAIGLTGRLAVLLIREPDAVPSERLVALCQSFGLTTAETRLTQALSNGDSLSDVAERLGISRHTAKAQLDAVFRKTNTGRQTELLVRLWRAL